MLRSTLAIALLVILGGCVGSDEYLLGRDLYDRSCVACHALDGKGSIGPEIGEGSNTALILSDEQIAGVITVGPGNMPGFSRFSEEQVDSLVEFVRSLAE